MDEASLVRDNVSMTQLSQKHRLQETLLFLFLIELAVDYFFRDKVDFLRIGRRISMLYKEGRAEVSPSNALELFKFLRIGQGREAVVISVGRFL